MIRKILKRVTAEAADYAGAAALLYAVYKFADLTETPREDVVRRCEQFAAMGIDPWRGLVYTAGEALSRSYHGVAVQRREYERTLRTILHEPNNGTSTPEVMRRHAAKALALGLGEN